MKFLYTAEILAQFPRICVKTAYSMVEFVQQKHFRCWASSCFLVALLKGSMFVGQRGNSGDSWPVMKLRNMVLW